MSPDFQVYLVGGAVRDELLGCPVRERDYVVVGATAELMQALGYRQVGRDFPVFLHPETHEEYALARSERGSLAAGGNNTGAHAHRRVTLREDLVRRDLTINTLARDRSGRLIDYYGGRSDLDRRILRHVSPAFAQDPVRILRVARFAARYAELGFRVAAETNELMQSMVEQGDVDNLVPERVWQELSRALSSPRPSVFFECLRDCGALGRILPEINRLWGVPQPPKWHPEIDTGVHVMMVIDKAAALSDSPEVRFAALTHDLGKAETPREQWPSHYGHEQRSAELAVALCARLHAPNRFRDLARCVALYHGHVHRAQELRPQKLLQVLENVDAFRRPERFEQLLLVCEADYLGRAGLESRAYPQSSIFRHAYRAAAAVGTSGFELEAGNPAAIGREVHRRRVTVIKRVLTDLRDAN